MVSTMPRVGRYGNAALSAGRMLATIGGLLLLAGTVYAWIALSSVGYWNFTWDYAIATAAACCLALAAIAAVMSGRLVADLLVLAATGWAVAWNSDQMLGHLPNAIHYHVGTLIDPFGTPWYLWAITGVGAVLGVAALLLIAGIARGVQAVRGVAPEVLLSQATPPGWHPDPAGEPGIARWWNGTEWTTHTRDVAHTGAA